jgi:hypothetical protein
MADMLTPFISSLVFPNCVSSAWLLPYAAILQAFAPSHQKNSHMRVLKTDSMKEGSMIDQEKKIVSLEEYRRARREEDDPMPPSCPHAVRRAPPHFLTLAVAAGGRLASGNVRLKVAK